MQGVLPLFLCVCVWGGGGGVGGGFGGRSGARKVLRARFIHK